MFLEHYKLYWKNYVNFRGRTPRSGYWFVQLWGFIINVIISLVALAVASSAGISLLSVALDSGFGSDPISLASSLGGVVGSVIGLLVVGIIAFAFGVANILPSIALSVRRLHDTGRRWFWLFLLYGPVIAYIAVALIALAGAYGIIVLYLVLPWVELVCAIIFLVLTCLPTSSNAIGKSTHDMYPQWQDGYGDSGGYYRHEPTSSATTTIVGISGMYRGAAFPLDDDEELILGRDAMLSHIVITENAEKVSRKHVSVSFDPYDQVYTVVDHSSNGTFLADGTRLVANIPVKLKRGSVIYLAKKENSFKLT